MLIARPMTEMGPSRMWDEEEIDYACKISSSGAVIAPNIEINPSTTTKHTRKRQNCTINS